MSGQSDTQWSSPSSDFGGTSPGDQWICPLVNRPDVPLIRCRWGEVIHLAQQDKWPLTHELCCTLTGNPLSFEACDLTSTAKVNELNVKSSSALHDDVVRLQVQVYDTPMVEELQSIQYLENKMITIQVKIVFDTSGIGLICTYLFNDAWHLVLIVLVLQGEWPCHVFTIEFFKYQEDEVLPEISLIQPDNSLLTNVLQHFIFSEALVWSAWNDFCHSLYLLASFRFDISCKSETASGNWKQNWITPQIMG